MKEKEGVRGIGASRVSSYLENILLAFDDSTCSRTDLAVIVIGAYNVTLIA